jgi:hypothetical protein
MEANEFAARVEAARSSTGGDAKAQGRMAREIEELQAALVSDALGFQLDGGNNLGAMGNHTQQD